MHLEEKQALSVHTQQLSSEPSKENLEKDLWEDTGVTRTLSSQERELLQNRGVNHSLFSHHHSLFLPTHQHRLLNNIEPDQSSA